LKEAECGFSHITSRTNVQRKNCGRKGDKKGNSEKNAKSKTDEVKATEEKLRGKRDAGLNVTRRRNKEHYGPIVEGGARA